MILRAGYGQFVMPGKLFMIARRICRRIEHLFLKKPMNVRDVLG